MTSKEHSRLPQNGSLAYFPITFFATTMGLGGLTMALRAAFGIDSLAYMAVMALTALVFATLAVVYAMKMIRYPSFVSQEWHHPVRLAFFPTATISLLILSSAALPIVPALAETLWVIAMIGQGILTMAVISGWIGMRSFQHGHISPAWFIPVVGNVIVPIAGVELGWIETSWLFFSAGLIFWLILLALVFNRLIFHDPLSGRLQPTLVIMIAPPSLVCIAWTSLNGGNDAFAHILLNIAYVFTGVVMTQLPRILKLPFALGFWALSFPVAALTIASLLYAEANDSVTHYRIGIVSLSVLIVIISLLCLRTIRAVLANEVCVPE